MAPHRSISPRFNTWWGSMPSNNGETANTSEAIQKTTRLEYYQLRRLLAVSLRQCRSTAQADMTYTKYGTKLNTQTGRQHSARLAHPAPRYTRDIHDTPQDITSRMNYMDGTSTCADRERDPSWSRVQVRVYCTELLMHAWKTTT